MSTIALWVLVLFETVLLLLLLRALGALRQQGFSQSMNPSISDGPEIGEQAPPLSAKDQDGNRISLDDFQGRRRLLAFVSPGCSACTGTIKAINTYLEGKQDFAVLVIGGTRREQNKVFAETSHSRVPILTLDTDTADSYRIRGFPLVLILDTKGIVIAKGIVNEYQHLQSLIKEALPAANTVR